MGLYDSVIARCPSCGAEIEFQTKEGPCQLLLFDLQSEPIPVGIAAALHGQSELCRCGAVVRVTAPFIQGGTQMIVEGH